MKTHRLSGWDFFSVFWPNVASIEVHGSLTIKFNRIRVRFTSSTSENPALCGFCLLTELLVGLQALFPSQKDEAQSPEFCHCCRRKHSNRPIMQYYNVASEFTGNSGGDASKKSGKENKKRQLHLQLSFATWRFLCPLPASLASTMLPFFAG